MEIVNKFVEQDMMMKRINYACNDLTKRGGVQFVTYLEKTEIKIITSINKIIITNG